MGFIDRTVNVVFVVAIIILALVYLGQKAEVKEEVEKESVGEVREVVEEPEEEFRVEKPVEETREEVQYAEISLFEFGILPEVIELKSGKVEINMINHGRKSHEVVVERKDISFSKFIRLRGGESTEVGLRLRKGSYSIYSPEYRSKGMIANVVVE